MKIGPLLLNRLRLAIEHTTCEEFERFDTRLQKQEIEFGNHNRRFL
nr:MAG TPA: hypothetical protein [Caudoviricetes sp.]